MDKVLDGSADPVDLPRAAGTNGKRGNVVTTPDDALSVVVVAVAVAVNVV